MTPEEARHDRQVCATFARRWHGTGRIVSVHTERGPFLEALKPDDPRPVAIVQFETDPANVPYSGQRISIRLDLLTPRYRPSGDDCPTCRARNDAASWGYHAAAAIGEHFTTAYRYAFIAAHHAREYFRLIEEAA